ncbi:MAG: hypothetical protein ABJB86_07165 [Bacteroidota bacterium]
MYSKFAISTVDGGLFGALRLLVVAASVSPTLLETLPVVFGL